MSEDTSDLSVQMRKEDISDTIKSKNESSQSLLSIVHDKNKTIEKLQRQLHFQKMQLKFYLGKTLSGTKMISFAKTCHAQAIDENLPVTLAVNRFNKQTGHKSQIISLYDRMCVIDGRISSLLHVQECFLKKVIGKICEFAKSGNEFEVQVNYRKMLSNPEYMDVFTNLIHANMGLKKSLETFRICCDRLIVVEEERNLIVEQVYSLPIEERTNCNYLIGIQIEKVQLQNRMKEILKDQIVLKDRIEELSTAEEQLRKLQEEYKNAFKSSTEHVTNMLRKVNKEALGLVEKSNLQREKYTKEIVKLKSDNCKISKLLERLKDSISDKVMSKDSLKLDSIYSAGLFQALDKEINQAIRENELNKNTTMQKVRSDCKELTQSLHHAQNQNILMTRELDTLNTEFDSVKQRLGHELAMVQRERDDYKAQVEDLQAIRSAYAQLVESRVDVAADEEKRRQERKQIERKRIAELEKENQELLAEVAELKEEVNKHKAKIVRLSGIILNLNGNDQKEIEMEDLIMRDIGSGDVGKEQDDEIPKSNTCAVCKEKGDLEKGIIFNELQKSNVTSKDLIQLIETRQLDEITSNILQGLSSTECQCGSSSCVVDDSLSQQHFEASGEHFDQFPDLFSPRVDNFPGESSYKAIATTFEIQSSHRDGKKDTIKGILEGRRKVEGMLKMGDTSMLSVKVKCISPIASINEENSISNESVAEEIVTVGSHISPVELVPQEVISERNVRQSESEIFEEQTYVSTTKDCKSIQVTYRNSVNYKMTDSESQCSDAEATTMAEARESEDRHKAARDLINLLADCRLDRTYTIGKVKSLSHLN